MRWFFTSQEEKASELFCSTSALAMPVQSQSRFPQPGAATPVWLLRALLPLQKHGEHTELIVWATDTSCPLSPHLLCLHSRSGGALAFFPPAPQLLELFFLCMTPICPCTEHLCSGTKASGLYAKTVTLPAPAAQRSQKHQFEDGLTDTLLGVGRVAEQV